MMRSLRRSMKGDKDVKPHHLSVQPKDAIAIVPPKKVIKARFDYSNPDDPSHLSFSAGDFLHVVGREADSNWYEACNPIVGRRGLVPVSYFENVDKTVRDSASSAHSLAHPSAPHDSGYAEPPSGIASPNNPDLSGHPAPVRISRAMGPRTGVMVYGFVMYNFQAERPDELEAKQGEAIVIIAQSNPEWFVAKPITRLGGPGLIPVSFVEIRDMLTDAPVPDPLEAVQRAGIPKVEEWKKMAADYKNGSIPLGKLEQTASVADGIQRLSMGHRSQAPTESSSYQNAHGGYGRNAFSMQLLGHGSMQPGAYAPMQDQHADPSHHGLPAPVQASVPRFCYANDIYWFIIECEMNNGQHWELSRLYQDFYDLQIGLISAYPVEAGTDGTPRTLSYMPGPVTYVTPNISNGRRANLDEYIKNLLRLGPHITHGHLVKSFFNPREGDFEIDPHVMDDEYRMSQGSHQSSDPSQGASRHSSADQLQTATPQTSYSTASGYAPQARSQAGYATHQYHGQSSLPPPLQHQQSSMSQTSTGTGTGLGSALKIKVHFENENTVVIRMPTSLSFIDLYHKLRERRALELGEAAGDEDLVVEYRDEVEDRFYPIENDEDLAIAVQRNPKLKLEVMVAR